MYQRALGQLNWLVRGTRLDLAFVVYKLSQHCHRPYEMHWTGVRRVENAPVNYAIQFSGPMTALAACGVRHRRRT
jgi:hypothetical protein